MSVHSYDKPVGLPSSIPHLPFREVCAQHTHRRASQQFRLGPVDMPSSLTTKPFPCAFVVDTDIGSQDV